MPESDITLLKELPLQALISAPLIAVIEGQAQAAATTAKFVEEIGFKRNTDDESFFDTAEDVAKNDYDVRMARLHVDANGKVTNVDLPFISLVNIPCFEISNFEWSFNVKLKSMETFSFRFGTTTTATSARAADFGLNIKNILKLGASMKVETTTKTDFESRYKSGREQEYNLAITVKGNSAPVPNGIAILLSIAENAAKQVAVPQGAGTPPGPGPAPTGSEL